jgi:ribosome-associated protein
MTNASDTTFENDLDIYVKAILGKKASDILILDVRGLTSVADAFLICSGRSNRQVTAIAENIHSTLKKEGIYPLSLEGGSEGHWVLIDYGHVIIHVFYEPIREFYDLEGLWQDAARVTTPSLAKLEKEPINEPE